MWECLAEMTVLTVDSLQLPMWFGERFGGLFFGRYQIQIAIHAQTVRLTCSSYVGVNFSTNHRNGYCG